MGQKNIPVQEYKSQMNTPEQEYKSQRNTPVQEGESEDIKAWVESILKRTTKRPCITSIKQNTPAKPVAKLSKSKNIFPGNILTKELQIQLQQLLKRRKISETKHKTGTQEEENRG